MASTMVKPMYADEAPVFAALRADGARLEERLALSSASSLERASSSGSGEGSEGQDGDNGGF